MGELCAHFTYHILYNFSWVLDFDPSKILQSPRMQRFVGLTVEQLLPCAHMMVRFLHAEPVTNSKRHLVSCKKKFTHDKVYFNLSPQMPYYYYIETIVVAEIQQLPILLVTNYLLLSLSFYVWLLKLCQKYQSWVKLKHLGPLITHIDCNALWTTHIPSCRFW